MVGQSYQEVSRVILEELVRNPVKFKDLEHHKYFYYLKMKEPKKYERLTFDTNGGTPYSRDLSEIFLDFKTCGLISYNNLILLESAKKYLDSKPVKEILEEYANSKKAQ
jgi:hypothetical protein